MRALSLCLITFLIYLSVSLSTCLYLTHALFFCHHQLDTARFAMMAIANLTSGPAARAPSVAAGALPACVEAALHPDEPEIRRYGAVALMNLSAAGNAAGSVLVAHGGLSPLLQLCQSPSDMHASRAALKAILNLAANPFLVLLFEHILFLSFRGLFLDAGLVFFFCASQFRLFLCFIFK